MKTLALFLVVTTTALLPALARAQGRDGAAPPDVKPIGITCEECPYPYDSSYFEMTTYGQEVRMAYMDVAPQGQPNGHTVLLLHGRSLPTTNEARRRDDSRRQSALASSPWPRPRSSR